MSTKRNKGELWCLSTSQYTSPYTLDVFGNSNM